MNISKLFVISGGPGSGKTTLLLELARLGLPTVPEVARQLIREQVRDGGAALPWDNRARFTSLMLARSMRSYDAHRNAPGPLFFDRGIPDTLCYARLIGLNEESIRQACEQHRYASPVFLTPPWREIYVNDGERKQDFAEACRTFELIAEVYTECGYQIEELPRSSPKDRAHNVLESVGWFHGFDVERASTKQ
jgi:predicted ATPase